MADSGGFGTVWTILVGTVATEVANVSDIQWPEIENQEVEITAHDSSGGYREWVSTGLKDVAELEMEIASWDVNEATHAQLVTLLGTGAASAMTITDPDSDESAAFNAIVKNIKRETPLEGARKAMVKIRVSGAITIT